MAIVKTDVPMTPRLCRETVQQLRQTYGLEGQTLTTTAWGRPVQTLCLGSGPRQVLFSAAHHANEWITAPVLLKFAEELAQAAQSGGSVFDVPAQTLLRCATIHLVPMADPDGVALVTGEVTPESPEYAAARAIADDFPDIPFPEGWKANLKGVDLNLQYPAGWLLAREIKFTQGFDRPAPRDYVGRAPLDQRESRALAEYTREVEPELVVALHTQGQVIYWQYRDYEIPGARALGEEFARLSGYTLEQTPYESAFAGYKDWFISAFRRPGFTVECGKGESPLPLSQFDAIYSAVLGILITAAAGGTQP